MTLDKELFNAHWERISVYLTPICLIYDLI